LLILDTDIASAFAKAGHFEVLVQLFGKVGITPMVYEELQTPLMHGYAFPDEIFNKAELVTVSGDVFVENVGSYFHRLTKKPYLWQRNLVLTS